MNINDVIEHLEQEYGKDTAVKKCTVKSEHWGIRSIEVELDEEGSELENTM